MGLGGICGQVGLATQCAQRNGDRRITSSSLARITDTAGKAEDQDFCMILIELGFLFSLFVLRGGFFELLCGPGADPVEPTGRKGSGVSRQTDLRQLVVCSTVLFLALLLCGFLSCVCVSLESLDFWAQ